MLDVYNVEDEGVANDAGVQPPPLWTHAAQALPAGRPAACPQAQLSTAVSPALAAPGLLAQQEPSTGPIPTLHCNDEVACM